MLQRLRLKFVLINMTIVMTMLCVILGMVYHFTRSNLENESIAQMINIAESPFRLGQPGVPEDGVQLPYFTIQIDQQGEVIATGGGYYDLSDEEFLQSIVRTAFDSGDQFGTIDEYNLRYYRAPAYVNQFLVFVDTSSEQATLNGLLRTSLIIGVLSFFLFLGISILLARWAVAPIDRAWRQQRQFVSDASHELKTPLTVVMTNAELLQNPAVAETDRTAYSANILTMSRRMRRLLEQLLQLARSDNALEQRPHYQPFDYSRMVADALLPFEPVFFENGLTLESEIAPGVTVRGDETALRQVLEILLDNAQKYSAPGGKTRVTLARRGRGHVILSVADQGDPIPAEHLEDLFRRFYRADEARSSADSFGLGLSIAESIVRRHRGHVWAESQGGWNTFRVELPVDS